MLRRKRLKSYPSLHLLIGNCFTYLWKLFHLLMENCFNSYTSHISAWSRLCNRPLTTVSELVGPGDHWTKWRVDYPLSDDILTYGWNRYLKWLWPKCKWSWALYPSP